MCLQTTKYIAGGRPLWNFGDPESAWAESGTWAIRVKAPEEEHTVTIVKVRSWLDGDNQSEKLKKSRLRERLRM